MKKIDKIKVLLLVAGVIMTAVYGIQHNWIAIMLWWAFVFAWCEITSLERIISKMRQHISLIEQSDNYRAVVEAEAYAECMMENARRFLIRIQELKAENRQLKILNKNLIENKNTGVKNYGKHTNRRTAEKGDKGNA